MARLASLTIALLVSLRHVVGLALVTAPPAVPTPHLLQGRDVSTSLSTCGFLNGDPSKPWVAPNGYNCRVDTLHGIWGFCPTTVISATDCGLGAFCFDSGPCRDTPDQTMCATAILIFGPDQSYDYVDCAGTAGKATYFVSPRDAMASTTSSQSSTTQTKQLGTSSATPQLTLSSPSSTTRSTPPNIATPVSSAYGTTSGSGNIASGSGSGSQTEQTPGGSSTSSSTNNTAAIIGGAVGGLALIVGGVIALVYILRRHNSAPHDTDAQHKARRSSPDTDVKYPEAGWGPSELAAGGKTPAELPAYWSSLAPAAHPAELPAGYAGYER
ncbi:hypothetical protein C8A01DRAFT_51275 [Parachaetomium inaequale]|uniref:Mid2 domain-containing protein n=1 Tax=Parachaetomium inaequale TaxID=2588326 RepID=A0AAN6SL71_9PEZI|nr:hypothetical protein C8A01DRAFT_51275 [Parachaetomium inaequale]